MVSYVVLGTSKRSQLILYLNKNKLAKLCRCASQVNFGSKFVPN